MAERLSNPFHHGSQNHALLERLRFGPVFNHEIVRELGILKYTARISDVRKKVRIQGFDVVENKILGSVHQYQITIPRHEKEKQEEGRNRNGNGNVPWGTEEAAGMDQ